MVEKGGDTMKMSGPLIGVLALIAGALILFNWLSLNLVIGIFLIAFGIITLMRR